MSNLTLIDVLRDQKQCDEDGHYCIVSRQAVDEAIAALQASPPSGGEVCQRLAQIAVYGDVWFDISREAFEATKEQGITRTLFTSPRVVDGVREAAKRVIKAFTALGDEHDQIATIMRHRECEASMTALQAALEAK